MQKKHASYQECKEDTVWSMDQFNEYINEVIAPYKDIEYDWVYNTLTVSTSCHKQAGQRENYAKEKL